MRKTEPRPAANVNVQDNTLASTGFPEGTITVDPSLSYVGGETFTLYDVARCEIHLYAEADESGRAQRLYWFQFEGYLPSASPGSYDYSGDPRRTVIGGHMYYDSVRRYNVEAMRGGWGDDSDTMHVICLLEREGYRLEGDVMRIRLVRLDESGGKELMIVYMEALERHGLSLTDFEGAGGDSRWREASEALRGRALAGVKIDMR